MTDLLKPAARGDVFVDHGDLGRSRHYTVATGQEIGPNQELQVTGSLLAQPPLVEGVAFNPEGAVVSPNTVSTVPGNETLDTRGHMSEPELDAAIARGLPTRR